ncbi:hypothetical protein KTQ42_15645|uniref:hypothetical protein n=1 Tax=Noviherbaspirillum sp. L7-7A TaxID=2850560 RepID=UPI001C2BC9F3|nr:hypothetical protein [Noviherbaspirillum sp. L7-7A]MBV0880735.1 hypothetical protein [Noviherbaspirillum sp. L7-7A]
MQARIYATQDALETAEAIKDLDYHSRMLLTDDEAADPSTKPGYYLKNANKLKLALLPADARVGICLSPEDPITFRRHVSMPANLRGCIFEKAPHLPPRYADIVTYWSGEPINANASGAVYFQNPLNEYMVDLAAISDADDDLAVLAAAPVDRLLSEGIVVCISGVEDLISDLSLRHFIEVRIPVSQDMLGVEPDDFRSDKAYDLSAEQQCERIFISVADIICSPDRDRIYIDLIRHELFDYGFFY